MIFTKLPRKRLLVSLAVLTVLAIAGCASTNVNATAHRSATPSASASTSAYSYTDAGGYTCDPGDADASGNCPANPSYAASATPSGPAMLSVGDSETLGDNSNTTIGTVTVDSVHVTTQPADPQFGSRPANGYYVIVHVKATADPAYTDGFNINELDFYDLTADSHYGPGNGNAYNALTDSQSNADLTTTLAAGETATGWMAFDVPSRHGAIVYSPNSDGQPIAEWSY